MKYGVGGKTQLMHSTGQEAKDARAAGADIVGGEELVKDVSKWLREKTVVSYLISAPIWQAILTY